MAFKHNGVFNHPPPEGSNDIGGTCSQGSPAAHRWATITSPTSGGLNDERPNRAREFDNTSLFNGAQRLFRTCL